jgi:uncharacterized membrane protein YdbT with pleckstrin-like domain
MVKESIEKLAREKAEKAAKQEAWKAYFAGSLPFFVVACIMALIGVPTVIYTIVVLMMPFAGWVLYSSIKSGAYKAYYKKYLEEFTILQGAGDKE